MSSGFSGGVPDFFSAARRSSSAAAVPLTTMNNNNNTNTYNANLNTQHQFSFRSPGLLPDPPAQIHRPDFTGKRSLSDFHHQNQQQQLLGYYLRNVKQRPSYYHNISPISPLSPVDFSSIAPEISSVSSVSMNQRYGLPIVTNRSVDNKRSARDLLPNKEIIGSESEKKMMMSHKLLELEKELLGDDEDTYNNDDNNNNNSNDAVSVITGSEWSDTIQELIINPTTRIPTSDPSPTSSSSSCSSTSASPPCTKQSLIDAAVAISDGKPESAAETLARLQQQVANARGTPEQRLAAYMVAALKPRLSSTQLPAAAAEIYDKEHTASTQMLYDVSPCFKLGFMAANLAILDATSEQGFRKIHVLDFDIGQGGQYVHLLHALAARTKRDCNPKLKISAFLDTFTAGGEEKLKLVGDGLKALADRIGVCLVFQVKSLNVSELTREKLGIEHDEALAVNFAFNLYKLPDESVTTENLRDETLRRVKSLSPAVTTVVEQEMNTNTAPLAARVRDACDHYGALFDSLDSTVSRNSAERVRIEEGLGRKMANAVACEGRDRLERCEVHGKWRARLSMAGFQPRVIGRAVVESLRVKVNSGTRGNPGFSVNEESGGGVGFGWMGRTITVASAWC